MARPKQDLIKITTNMNVNVLRCLDEFAKDSGITRTTAITILLSKQLGSLGYGQEGSRG